MKSFKVKCPHAWRGNIFVIRITFEEIQSSSYENQPVGKDR